MNEHLYGICQEQITTKRSASHFKPSEYWAIRELPSKENTGHGVRIPGSSPSSVHSGFETLDESFPLFTSALCSFFQQPRLVCSSALAGPFLWTAVPFCPLSFCTSPFLPLGKGFYPCTPQSLSCSDSAWES